MKHEMTREEKLMILRHNVMTGIDGIEASLRHNIGDENADFFIHPIRQLLQAMETCLES